jgi:hypothetical protein
MHAESSRKLRSRDLQSIASPSRSLTAAAVSRAFLLSVRPSQDLYRAVAQQAQHVWVGIGGDGAICFRGFGHVAFARGQE